MPPELDRQAHYAIKITGVGGAGGGKYAGIIGRGTCTAVLAGTLTEPEGVTFSSDDTCLVLNKFENGLSGVHLLANDTYHTGMFVGMWNATPIVEIDSPPSVTVFAVLCYKTGGAAGDIDTDCAFVYTIKDERGETLGTGLSPARLRIPKCEYFAPADGSRGTGFYSGTTFVLLSVEEERPKGDIVSIPAAADGGDADTILNVDDANYKFRAKLRRVNVLEVGALGDWDDWYTGGACP
jgi:hypothetical protein